MRQVIRRLVVRAEVLTFLDSGGVCEVTIDAPVDRSAIPPDLIANLLHSALPGPSSDDGLDIDDSDPIEVG